ncbi:hypothetical protein Bpfe_003258 [Biomphalaria pfeifferi]|uniref:Uncharacterized protein n=1 Tax=Biomphalaria pfeifferi TaxID=112525 RepID=A0AAD8FK00_BIOPF|nr:hypothetical protein Bpfe_003258 [Biomphalaria pfeifferi]
MALNCFVLGRVDVKLPLPGFEAKLSYPGQEVNCLVLGNGVKLLRPGVDVTLPLPEFEVKLPYPGQEVNCLVLGRVDVKLPLPGFEAKLPYPGQEVNCLVLGNGVKLPRPG